MRLPKNLARFVLFVLLTLSMTGVARGGTRDPNTPDEKYVEFGKSFPYVVRICSQHVGTDENGRAYTEQWCASAVVIRKHWILTAAHVIRECENALVRTDDDTKYPLIKLITHADYDAKKLGWHDIALGRTAKAIELEFYPALYKNTDELSQACTVSGWGLAGTFHTGGTLSDNKRRAGHNKIDGAADSVLFCSPSRGADRFPLEFMITPGDSGGGMFIGNSLAGINSFLMAADGKPNGSYTDEMAFTRVSMYVNWVESQIENYELAAQARATEGANISP